MAECKALSHLLTCLAPVQLAKMLQSREGRFLRRL